MKPASLFFTCLALPFYLAVATVANTAQAQDETVSLNFSNAEITSVIEAIGKISGRNFLVDPRVKGTLNIITNTPIARELTYPVLLSALRLQGYTAIEADGITKILPEADAKQHGAPVSAHNKASGDRLVTRVFAMQHESAAQMQQVIRPLVTPNNTVTAFPSSNVLVVTDYADNLVRIGQIIDSIDVAQGDTTVIELQHAFAADLADTLTRVVNTDMNPANVPGMPPGAINMGGMGGDNVQIVADARTNSLLVRANHPAKIRAVRQLVASLDRPGAGGNIHVVYLKNAEASKVAQTLNAALTSEPGLSNNPAGQSSAAQTANTQDGRQAGNLASAQQEATLSGMVQADVLNNALIIVAPEPIYRNLRAVIDQLDRRRAQVYIEALIAEISTERAAEFGIQWQSTNMPTGGKGGRSVFGGTSFGGRGQNIIGAMGDPSSVGHGLNLLVGTGTVSVPINGKMVDIMSLGMLARFLESDSRTNILSTPTIVTLDNEEAKIVVGRNLPFVTGQYTNTGGGTTPANPFQTIERQDVGLTLEVRPQITEGGIIKLEIYQEASALLPAADTSNGPTTSKRSIKSNVLVDDGAIIALGGLVEDTLSSGEEKVPLLGDIPLAGQLFRYNTKKRAKTNLIVFLRPVILRDKDSYVDLTRTRYQQMQHSQQTSQQSSSLLLGDKTPPQLADLPPPTQAAPPLANSDPFATATAAGAGGLADFTPLAAPEQAPAPVEDLLPAPAASLQGAAVPLTASAPPVVEIAPAAITTPAAAVVASAPEPVAAAPEPVVAAPEPVAAAPEPVAAAPEPVAAAPEPIAAAPEPVAAAPEPVAAAPEPEAAPRMPILLTPRQSFSAIPASGRQP